MASKAIRGKSRSHKKAKLTEKQKARIYDILAAQFDLGPALSGAERVMRGDTQTAWLLEKLQAAQPEAQWRRGNNAMDCLETTAEEEGWRKVCVFPPTSEDDSEFSVFSQVHGPCAKELSRDPQKVLEYILSLRFEKKEKEDL